jgi:membrane protein DedA with SNARE-associated domain
MAGIKLTALFGFVALILSYGIFVPADLRSFSFIGAVASMAGYAIGNQAAKAGRTLRIILILISAVVCLACIVLYVIYVQRGTGDVADVILLAILLFGIFFSFTFLMPIAGVAIDKSA